MKQISCPCDPSTRATASGRGPSLGMGSREKGSLRGVARSGAQRSRRETKWVPWALPGGTHRRMPFILALMLLITLSGCAPVLFKKPLSDQELGKVVSLLKAQEEAANAFYTTGQMVVKDWYWDQEANTLMAGTRTPLRLRMEITHAWGQPILHLLIIGKTFKALSYGERKLYIGDLN